ncbi:PD-(D/E)XK nuclease family protein [Patescibacteria group bacterium]|nr:PD-(D/E)XK nuclease family protein [Patescibacteria group bacterium]
MSQFYSGKRSRNLYEPSTKESFRLSRSKIENFLKCPRCFYLDRRLGVDQPPGYPFSLNAAVDTLLKKEFNLLRTKREPHPLFKEYGIDAVPFQHPKMDEWRETLKGLQYYHEPSGFLVTGAVDDIWQNSEGELHVVDYKATAKNGEVNLDADWQRSYKNQMEIYQWLLRHQPDGFKVSPLGYFVYVNGKMNREAFDARLEFDMKIILYKGDDSWIEKALMDAKKVLDSDKLPQANEGCDYCLYRKSVQDVLQPFQKSE